MEIQMFDSFDNMMDAIAAGRERAKAAMSAAQRRLCDGEEHYALTMERYEDGEWVLALTRIWSRLEFEARSMKPVLKYDTYESEEAQEALSQAFYELDVYWGEGGSVEYGYLPGETWDSVYNRDPDDGDLHDRHASMMLEITKDEFDEFQSCGWDFNRAQGNPVTLNAMARWVLDVQIGGGK